MKAAGAIIDHFNRQKFIMLGLQDKESGMQPVIPKRVARVLAMETKNGDGVIMPSEISQKHISEKVGSSYPVSKALELIGEAARLGFGEIDDHTSPHNRRITKWFTKRKLDALTMEVLKKSRISDEMYSKAFAVPDPSLMEE